MGKQIKLTDHQQEVIESATKALAKVILQKMDEGVENPSLSGTINIDGEKRVVEFEISAKSVD